jgi:hypothetical protein
MTYWNDLHGGKERTSFGNWTGKGTCGSDYLKRFGGCSRTETKREEVKVGSTKLYSGKLHRLYSSSDMIR